MKKMMLIVMIVAVLTGCATYQGPGSTKWQETRMIELDEMKAKNQITEKEYFAMRQEIESTVAKHRGAVVSGLLAGRNN